MYILGSTRAIVSSYRYIVLFPNIDAGLFMLVCEMFVRSVVIRCLLRISAYVTLTSILAYLLASLGSNIFELVVEINCH